MFNWVQLWWWEDDVMFSGVLIGWKGLGWAADDGWSSFVFAVNHEELWRFDFDLDVNFVFGG